MSDSDSTARATAKADKRSEKRRQIIESASDALRRLGYARTSLRDIAALSGLSLGSLHYYFEDRTDLILFCVHHYKDGFLEAVRDAVAGAQGRQDTIAALSSVLATTLDEAGMTHRLWYDIRSQAMFDPAFEPVMRDIEASMVAIFVEIEERLLGHSRNAALNYAATDGMFRFYLQSAPDTSREVMQAAFAGLLVRLWSPDP